VTITPGNRRSTPNDVLIGILYAREAGMPLEGNPRHHAWIAPEQFAAIGEDRTYTISRNKVPTKCRFHLTRFMGGLYAVPEPYYEPTPAAAPLAQAA
jgi:hypothetical protein